MNAEDIEKFIRNNQLPKDKFLKISFKKRNTMYGVFVESKDATDLQAKNFWRIVSSQNIQQWNKSKDLNLSRIFHGSDFAKLSIEN